jgi:hypothetical protein
VTHRSVLLTAAALLVLLASASTAEACSCFGTGGPCESFGAASAVFVGTVVDRTDRSKPDEKGVVEWTPFVYRFSVLQPFLGVESAEFEVSSGRGGGDCGYGFRKGETYLVYAYGGGDGKPPSTGICTRTRPVADAAEDLEFLRSLPARGAGVTVSVTVERQRQRIAAGDSKPAGGLSGARVTFEGAGESREVTTDSEGRARLSGLKPGAYKVRLALPEGLTAYKAEQEVKVADRGCARVHYAVADDGRVSGRVTEEGGRAAAGVLVALLEAEDPDPQRHYTRLERTDEEGRYLFKSLPPGRYLLAVNFNRYPQPGDPTNAYPRTFYPGVARASQAEVISLGAGESVKEKDITLPARRGESVVEGVVVWEDGRPVPGAHLSYRDVTYNDPGSDNGGPRADDLGRFRLEGYQGQALLIHARSDRQLTGDYRRDGPMERSEPARVTLAAPTETVRIVITKLR